MNSLLPNLRWLCLPSENLGKDWFHKSQIIDSHLQEEGMDLSEEVVYLIYSHTPEEVMEGEGQCLVARPVIGPKKEMAVPMRLIDWKASSVERFRLGGGTMDELLEEARNLRPKASRAFVLSVKRELKPDLKLDVEAIFMNDTLSG